MKNRILVAIFGIPLLFYILYSGGLLLLLFANVIIGVSLYEFYNMMEGSGRTPYRKIGLLTGIAIPNLLYLNITRGLDIEVFSLLAVVFFIGMAVERIMSNRVEESSLDIGGTALGILYISILFSHILLISKLPSGTLWILAAQIMVWICDSFAYFVGLATGRKFFKEGLTPISPKKSKEGSLGGLIFTVIALFVMKYTLLKGIDLSGVQVVVIAIIVALVAQVGDLVESLFKREFKIKDSSNLLGEHGGMLDRFDSMIFVVPVLYYALKYIIL